jgi:N12 class adenine-specific DNA methylase
MGMLPEQLNECKMYGIELDTISGEIARQLYQKNTIAVKAYQDVELPDSFFDVAVGNVPFDDLKPYDKKYDKYKFVLHDYFFAKTLDKVRPNGIIAFITSKGTMDKKDESTRKYISQRAELIGAIRLPNDTFQKNAGTTVTTDIIFLKKRDKVTDIDEEWIHLGTNENGIEMNNYFITHPEMILGNMEMISGRFGQESACIPYSDRTLEIQLNEAIENLNAEIDDFQIDELLEDEEKTIPADPSVRNFSYTIVDNQVYYRENSLMYYQELPLTAISRIKGMIEIRDCVRNLIELQLEDYPNEDIKREQAKLNSLYDKFTKSYGLINSRANEKAFSEDDSYYLLCSLEIVDENKNFVRKADMFNKRTIKPRTPISKTDNSIDALISSISERATVDLEYMSKLTGKTEEQLIKDLEGSIFKDPMLEKYVTADEYLSGNIREKLKIAKEFAENNPEYEINIKSLESVIPKDLSASEISVRLGATWIPPRYIEEFIFELLETPSYNRDDIRVNYSNYTSDWSISGKNVDWNNSRVNTTYGTKRINAYHIIEKTLNLKDVQIFDNIINIDGKQERKLNAQETAIAQGKQEIIKTKFEEWIWKDRERREELTRLYNDKFNCIRPREYDGKYINFVGMNPEITLRKHQLNAVARQLYGGNTLLAHEVRCRKNL